MPLEAPHIDNRSFDDIVDEAKTRIPRYTPEWTDLNDNDPGMAMLQVFAWMTEMLIYRLNKVPELNYIKFLQLIGIELRPAEPARAEVTFPVVEGQTEPYVIVPERTQIGAESDEGEQVVFETERSLVALTAKLAAVQSYDGFSHTPLTEKNDEVEGLFHPFGRQAPSDSALLMGFAYDGPFPAQIELNLTFWAAEDTVEDAGTSEPFLCGLEAPAVYPSASLSWEYWDGRAWQAVSLLKDETRALAQSGHVYLETPARGEMRRARIGAVDTPLYWIRARVSDGSYERPPTLLGLRTNTVEVIQAETVRDEVLGGSNGRPHQTFQLDNAPVLEGTLALEVDEGEGYQKWTQVEDFFGSGSDDRHFVLNRTTGAVEFGEKRIPVANVDNPTANILAREYRVGGGAAGNVAAGRVSALLSSVRGIDANGVANLRPATGGQDEETLEEVKERAPRSIKSQGRAVTEEDFEELATQVANVERAKALPLHHPDFPDVPVPGVVTVIVVPETDAPNPLPSDGTRRTVCAYLDQRRLLTTEVYVVGPTYRHVEIRGEVVARNDADRGKVKKGVEKALRDYLHPLKGGETGQGWPFGGDLYYSQIYQRVFTVPGVERIEQLMIVLDGEEHPECQDVSISRGTLVYSTEHDVRVSYSFDT